MVTLSFEACIRLLVALADDMITHKDELTALDAALGDGDLGRTVERGFRAIKALLETLPATDAERDIGKLLFKMGKTFADSAASSFGALLGTAFMKLGMAFKGKPDIALSALPDALQVALDALMERGKAKVGDKTMLDALHPTIQAMRSSLTANLDSVMVLRAAADAAQAGASRTAGLQSQIGRASWQGERSIGHIDAGAQAVAFIFLSIARHIATQKAAPNKPLTLDSSLHRESTA